MQGDSSPEVTMNEVSAERPDPSMVPEKPSMAERPEAAMAKLLMATPLRPTTKGWEQWYSICSRHALHDPTCELCREGDWKPSQYDVAAALAAPSAPPQPDHRLAIYADALYSIAMDANPDTREDMIEVAAQALIDGGHLDASGVAGARSQECCPTGASRAGPRLPIRRQGHSPRGDPLSQRRDRQTDG